MKIVFLGSGAFGLPTLQRLAQEHRVVGVVTQPDRPAGRGGRLTPTPIGEWAAQHLAEIPLVKPEKINTHEVRDLVRSWECDAWVVIAFGQKLGQKLLADRFAINLHASLLPRWRGAAPINHAVLAGDTVTGNSVITLAEQMDAGFVLGQSRREILADQTAGELHDLLASDGPDLVQQVLGQHASGTLQPCAQDESLVSLAGKLAKTDGWIDFAQAADRVRCRVNGLSPWPGVTVVHDGTDLKWFRAEPAGDIAESSEPGTVLDPARGLVACGGGTAVVLAEVQPAGKKPMSFRDYANGRKMKPGDRLIGRAVTGTPGGPG
jgi:methionyl-tRNA formyltransferase